MFNLKDYDFFIFDCDGVILNSNELKNIAFKEVLSDETDELINLFIDYHKSKDRTYKDRGEQGNY